MADKTDVLLGQFLAKSAHIITRKTSFSLESKTNKWFNLETPEDDKLKHELKFWKSQISNTFQAPPLIIDILLDISPIWSVLDSSSINTPLMLRNPKTGDFEPIRKSALLGLDSQQRKIEKGKILLETWQLTLSNIIPATPCELPVVYKKSIIFFRSLYQLVQLLPAFKLASKLKSPQNSNLSESGIQGLKIIYRVSSSRVIAPNEAGLDEIHITGSDMRQSISEYSFEPIMTPLGVFNMHVAYRLDCAFSLRGIPVNLGKIRLTSATYSEDVENTPKNQRFSLSNYKNQPNNQDIPSSSIPVKSTKFIEGGVETQQYGAGTSSSLYRFRPVDASSKSGKRDGLGNSNIILEHFTPPSLPSSSLNRKSVLGRFEVPPFVSSVNPASIPPLYLETLPFANIPGTPPFASPLNVEKEVKTYEPRKSSLTFTQPALETSGISILPQQPLWAYQFSPPTVHNNLNPLDSQPLSAFCLILEQESRHKFAPPQIYSPLSKTLELIKHALKDSKNLIAELEILESSRRQTTPFPAASTTSSSPAIVGLTDRKRKSTISGTGRNSGGGGGEEEELLFTMSELDL